MNFFTKNPNLKKKKKNFWQGVEGGGGTRVSEFFYLKRGGGF